MTNFPSLVFWSSVCFLVYIYMAVIWALAPPLSCHWFIALLCLDVPTCFLFNSWLVCLVIVMYVSEPCSLVLSCSFFFFFIILVRLPGFDLFFLYDYELALCYFVCCSLSPAWNLDSDSWIRPNKLHTVFIHLCPASSSHLMHGLEVLELRVWRLRAGFPGLSTIPTPTTIHRQTWI